MRIGHGYDAHRFDESGEQTKPFIIGGIEIPYDRSLLAHSDGDVLIHALCDALLGALGRGDIGHHFPDTDPQFKNIDSAELLSHVMNLLSEEGWHLGNADLTILAQAPKMAPHIQAMRLRLAQLLNASEAQVNIKASTTEGMGFVGRKEGIETYASVLICRDQYTSGEY
ncbi:MAG: 2-C-methyl-D-erythritol 2,4-cyclodiphosphate synthase [Pseudohongiellaceae bacterium]|nr:2-C-methyl-D-erythritol 2,4-cyclodiphosphate synthase [Pseudohongiellaceae bacterium]